MQDVVELAQFVAAESEPGRIVAFDPQSRPAEMGRQPLHRLERRRKIGQAQARKSGEAVNQQLAINLHRVIGPARSRSSDNSPAVGVAATIARSLSSELRGRNSCRDTAQQRYFEASVVAPSAGKLASSACNVDSVE
ncbi:hypothetical protein [Bradyrhizobium arachidis]|uniref:hypothetical protein n=1 Tax=Bradyrhizobium arachidis TaxID=858423 RepID=UPI001FCDE577|nr:hypothetical protein [Bradyrhizobium arachidis]